MAHKEVSGQLNAAGLKFGIVISRFNSIFTQQLLKGALDCLVRHGGSEEQVTVVWVPGANEIPLAAEQLVARGGLDAIIAEPVSETGLGVAIMDRLRRAAGSNKG